MINDHFEDHAEVTRDVSTENLEENTNFYDEYCQCSPFIQSIIRNLLDIPSN